MNAPSDRSVPARIRFKLLENGLLPTLGSEQAAGFDLYAAESVTLRPCETVKVRLGFAIEMPSEMYAEIAPRSSMNLKNILCHKGVIDSDYRGEVAAALCLLGYAFVGDASYPLKADTYQVKAGDRIAQLIFHRVEPVALFVVDELSATKRGQGAFGSTGR